MRSIDFILDGINTTSRVIAATLTLALTIVMLLQVIFRFGLNNSLQWSERLSIYFMIWLVFIGAAVVMYRWEHVSITLLARVLPPKSRAVMAVLAKLVTLVFLVAVVFYGFEVFNQNYHAKAPSIPFSTKWVKLAIPVGGVLMLVFALNATARDILAIQRGNYHHFDLEDADSTSSEPR